MKIDIASLFPAVCESYLSASIIGRARTAGVVEVNCHNIRDYAENKHRSVDDKPYGGGTGMIIQAQPVYSCICGIIEGQQEKSPPPRLIYMSPQGKTLTQELVKELAKEPWLVILCGHYEGIDCRVLEELAFEEISVGDYVVTGGELPALILTDSLVRLQEGVLPDSSAYTEESHWDGLLEHPLYTRPEVWRGRKVPETLLSGHHAEINKWRAEESLNATAKKRPDMYNFHK
ncbi:MAG: tRNA (guanosine(37)-N1)-methyltransferase TrmD [Oscillospiraceae bacterium]|nr:tRNA (guanosine(37)-N1)-methyltransferase TrmD [Oscillospiraceae bacterium]